MKKNMGNVDRVIRILIAIVLAILILTGQTSGVASIILGIIAMLFIITSIVGICPGYMPFKINTCKKESNE